MKYFLLFLSLILGQTTFAKINWISASGQCQLESSHKTIPLVPTDDPAMYYGVVARINDQRLGLDMFVQDVYSNIAIRLRGTDFDTEVLVSRQQTRKPTNNILAAYSKELKTWISCDIKLEDRKQPSLPF